MALVLLALDAGELISILVELLSCIKTPKLAMAVLFQVACKPSGGESRTRTSTPNERRLLSPPLPPPYLARNAPFALGGAVLQKEGPPHEGTRMGLTSTRIVIIAAERMF